MLSITKNYYYFFIKRGIFHITWLARPLQDLEMLHSLVALAVCLGSLSCWKTLPRPIFNALTEGQNLTIHGPIHPPLNTVQSSCPLCRKAPPKHDVSTPMLHGWDGVLGIVLILLPPNTARGVYTKTLYFGLIWPSPMPSLDHPDGLWQTSDGPGHVLAWVGGPCACCGTLMHDVV